MYNRSKRHTPNHYTNRGFNRVIIWAIFTGHVLARISILPKISRFWLFALCRSIIAWHPRELLRAQQTAPYAYESRSLYFDVIQQSVCSAELEWTKVEWMNKRTHLTCARICITLNALRRSHLLTHHDWSIMYNASMLLVNHYLQQVWQQENRAKYRNPGKDVSCKNGTYSHPRL